MLCGKRTVVQQQKANEKECIYNKLIYIKSGKIKFSVCMRYIVFFFMVTAHIGVWHLQFCLFATRQLH